MKRLETIPEVDVRLKQAYEEERRLFGKWDASLNVNQQGPLWFGRPDIASMVNQCLHYSSPLDYNLHTFCIMPNHVHMVFTPTLRADETYRSLDSIMHSIKSFTAHQAKKILGRKGAFWQSESYDHVVRDAKEGNRIAAYIIYNPVKAGLVDDPDDWPWTYVAEGLMG
ncbi:MAG: transposase [Anaerolineae bacterium]|nr:transposase [Anaerolineae bacterium]